MGSWYGSACMCPRLELLHEPYLEGDGDLVFPVVAAVAKALLCALQTHTSVHMGCTPSQAAWLG